MVDRSQDCLLARQRKYTKKLRACVRPMGKLTHITNTDKNVFFPTLALVLTSKKKFKLFLGASLRPHPTPYPPPKQSTCFPASFKPMQRHISQSSAAASPMLNPLLESRIQIPSHILQYIHTRKLHALGLRATCCHRCPKQITRNIASPASGPAA